MENESFNKEVEQALQQWAKNKEEVPLDYFHSAPQKVLQAINTKKEKSTLIYTFTKLAVAAVILSIIVHFYFINNNSTTMNQNDVVALKDLSTEEIETYLAKNDIDVSAVDDNSLSNEMEIILSQSQDSLNN